MKKDSLNQMTVKDDVRVCTNEVQMIKGQDLISFL